MPMQRDLHTKDCASAPLLITFAEITKIAILGY